MNQNAPAATAPKGGDFITFEPFADEGPTILTIVAYNFMKDHTFVRQDGSTEVADSLEFFLGTSTDKGPRFAKMWPTKYSIHEKSNYSKLYKAALGKLPAPGSSPNELIGKGVTANLENVSKTSKKGTPYTFTQIKGVSPVMKQLIGSIVPQTTLAPAFTAAVDKGKNKGANPSNAAQPASPATGNLPDEDVPF